MQHLIKKTDLEIFQAFRIEALEKRNIHLEQEIYQAKVLFQELVDELELEEGITVW